MQLPQIALDRFMEAVAIRVHAYQAGGLEAIHEKAVGWPVVLNDSTLDC